MERITHPSDARRYEAGTANLLGIAGLRASLALLEEFGAENIEQELARQRAWFVPALQAKGYTVLQAASPRENAGSIYSIHREGTDMAALHATLAAAGAVVSLRCDRAGQSYLRIDHRAG